MKKGDGGVVWLLLLIFALGCYFTYVGVKNRDYIFGRDVQDVNEMIMADDIPDVGEVVSIKAKLILDWYAELTERGAKGSRKTTYHCMVLLDNNEVISLSVKLGDDYNKIEWLIEDSYDYLTGATDEMPDPVYFAGTVRKIDSQIIDYYSQGLEKWGLNFNRDAYNIEIDTTQSRWVYMFMLFFGVLIVGAMVVPFISGLIPHKKKAIKADDVANEQTATNDPIFNDAFYNTTHTGAANNGGSGAEQYETTRYESGITQEDEPDTDNAVESKSKFTLKKD